MEGNEVARAILVLLSIFLFGFTFGKYTQRPQYCGGEYTFKLKVIHEVPAVPTYMFGLLT